MTACLMLRAVVDVFVEIGLNAVKAGHDMIGKAIGHWT